MRCPNPAYEIHTSKSLRAHTYTRASANNRGARVVISAAATFRRSSFPHIHARRISMREAELGPTYCPWLLLLLLARIVGRQRKRELLAEIESSLCVCARASGREHGWLTYLKVKWRRGGRRTDIKKQGERLRKWKRLEFRGRSGENIEINKRLGTVTSG